MSDETPRVQPFFCPYCGEQDLRPSATSGWHCRTCDRAFALSFTGLGDTGIRDTLLGSSSDAAAPDRATAERGTDRLRR